MDSILDSSTEELSTEQRLMLRSSKRQEPQGEEHNTNEDRKPKELHSVTSASCSGLGGLTMMSRASRASSGSSSSSESSSTSSSICGDCDHDQGGSFHHGSGLTTASNSNSNSVSRTSNRNSGGERNPNNMSLDSNSHSTYNTLIIHRNNSSLLADTWIPASHEFTSIGIGNTRNSACSNSGLSQSPSKDGEASGYSGGQQGQHGLQSNPNKTAYENLIGENVGGSSTVTSSEISDIPRDYLDQLTVLKHLAKEVQQDPICGSPSQNLLRSASFSKSQPDLTQSSILSNLPISCSHDYDSSKQMHQSRKKKHPHSSNYNTANSGDNSGFSGHLSGDEVLPSVQILEILMRENSNLKAELVNARRRINTIHKLEAELSRLSAQHAALFESSERRESLERTARAKLSTEVKRLTAVNRELLCTSNSLQNLSPYAISSDMDIYKKELSKKDLTIAQLVSQNKELVATKERQEIELAAQRATLAEQRTHIDILDSALTNAQANVLRLEEEGRKKQEYVEKVSQLQRALSSLQLSNEKREQSEKKFRTQLESEITDLKLQLASENANTHTHSHPITSRNGAMNGNMNSRLFSSPPPYPGSSGGMQNQPQNFDTTAELQILQEKIRISEEKILTLNALVTRWEHFFSMDGGDKPVPSSVSASAPNTPNSWSSRGGTPHFFGGSSGNGNGSGNSSTAGPQEDLPTTQNRAADLEWKVKDLESRLVERDAMIRVLNLQNVPKSPTSPVFSSLNSSSSSNVNMPPSYRESPCYSSAASKMLPVATTHPPVINHQVSVSLASMVDQGNNNHNHTQTSGVIDPVLMYSKIGKCDSEPPSYANLPLKMRLGGSGSSLAKNSNESLGSAGLPGGATSSNSGPGSVSSGGSNTKSIDEQLKELDHQLLSKGGPSLKMQSGLCCIPGFSHPGSATRKGKVPQSLLESLSQSSNNNNISSSNQNPPYKKPSVLPPLPKPPNFSYQNSSQSQNQQTTRTSSGPPFISPSTSLSTMTPPVGTTTLSLSNSVDSILSDGHSGKNGAGSGETGGGNVFSPVSALPKGLPPKSPGIPEAGKCRSLEREQRNKPANEPGAGKYTAVTYDPARCKSLDRRELKAQARLEEKASKEKEEKEKKMIKTSVSSKAAFFGGLLTRRSPSPSRQKEKERERAEAVEQSKVPIVQPKAVRFPFSRVQQSQQDSNSDQDIDTAFLDMQGRSSQRNRISKWTMSNSNLEAVQEQSSSGSESPWVQRRSGEPFTVDPNAGRSQTQSPKQVTFETKSSGNGNDSGSDDKKWGRVVKTPFGLRYTFGSPRIAEVSSSSSGKNRPHENNNSVGHF